MLSVMDIVIFGMGFICLLTWLIFFFAGLKHAYVFDALEEKEFPLKEIYFVGYEIMEILHYQYKSPGDRKLRENSACYMGKNIRSIICGWYMRRRLRFPIRFW